MNSLAEGIRSLINKIMGTGTARAKLPSERLTVINMAVVDSLPDIDREAAHRLLTLLTMRTQQNLNPGQRFQVIKRNRRGLFSRFKDKDYQGGLF